MTRPLRVFLCHASQDKPAVRELSRRLTGEGWIDTWLDEKSLLPGQDWRTKIEEAVEESDIVIICLSIHAITKEGHVQKELRYAREIALEKPDDTIFIIPLRLDECDVPRGLRFYQWVDYYGENKDDSYNALVASLKLRYEQRLKIEEEERIRKEEEIRKQFEYERESKIKEMESEAIRYELIGDFWNASRLWYEIKRIDPLFPRADLKIKELEREIRLREKAKKILKVQEEKEDIHGQPEHQQEPKHFFSKLPSRTFRIAGLIVIGLLIFTLGANSLFQSQNLFATSTPTKLLPSSTPTSPTATKSPTNSPTLTFTPAPELGSTMIGEDNMTLVFVPSSEFIMGSSGGHDTEPIHQVYLDAYWIDQTEITNSMYRKCVEANRCTPPSKISSHTNGNYYGNDEFDDYPVIYVSWHDADNYCSYVQRRLPTEAEWEKAARGTNGNIYPWGNTFDGTKLNSCDSNCEFVWANRGFNDNYADVAPVGSYPAGVSNYGVLDMAGNVWEWVNDWYDVNYYQNSPSSNPQGPNSGRYKVLRGGSWYDFNLFVSTTFRGHTSYILANYVNFAYRDGYSPSDTDKYIGFRCALSE